MELFTFSLLCDILLYRKHLDNDFISYNNKVDSLKRKAFPKTFYHSVEQIIFSNSQKADNLKAKIHNETIVECYTALSQSSNNLLEAIKRVNNIIEEKNILFTNKIQEKLNNKYSAFEKINIDDLEAELLALAENLAIYQNALSKFNESANSYLSTLSEETINTQIKDLQSELTRLTNIFYRNKYNSEIQEYQSLNSARNACLELSRLKKIEFENEQSVFLDTFFDDIDKYYSLLGSQNYKIEKETSLRGTNKTYSIKLKFRGKEIAPNEIKYVLSESDKRTLALAVYLSKLKHTMHGNTIVVLDDPITSFDIDRMVLFINILKEIIAGINQVIVFTHYENFYKRVVDLTHSLAPALIKINWESSGNQLAMIDPALEELLMEDYQKHLHNIIQFVLGNSNNYHSVDARTFMQKYLEYFFAYDIKNKALTYRDLKELLDILLAENLLDNNSYNKLNIKREEYNFPAHQYDSYTELEKRNSIKQLYDLLHEL